ncbi:hypothetical protein HPB50_016806 [Hyalomma asiaticum]|uniref:Uncharacterized protein n=1 Tax=Hyalomma asiaticum TaxID=266040 RepID=A0ACB7SIP8_HYAAI|nr:hypothetical protein HPB50_016806 [Hyalomma asiaticum]
MLKLPTLFDHHSQILELLGDEKGIEADTAQTLKYSTYSHRRRYANGLFAILRRGLTTSETKGSAFVTHSKELASALTRAEVVSQLCKLESFYACSDTYLELHLFVNRRGST